MKSTAVGKTALVYVVKPETQQKKKKKSEIKHGDWICYRAILSLQLKINIFALSFSFLFFIQLANKYWAPHVKKKLCFDSKVRTPTRTLPGYERRRINDILSC